MYLYVTYYIKNYLQYSIKTPKGIYKCICMQHTI